jgi:hypothetical protein
VSDGGSSAADPDVQAVVLAIVPLDLKLGEVVLDQEFGKRLDECHV